MMSAWKQTTSQVTLPSGNEVTLRQVDVLSILSENGDVPNFLLDIMNGGGKGEVKVTDMLAAIPLLNRIARLCLVTPRIAEDEDTGDGGISIHQVVMYDKLAIMMWCMGGEAAIRAIRNFLEQQGEGVSTV